MMLIGNIEVVAKGTFCRVIKLRNESYEYVTDPVEFLKALRQSRIKGDIFTFLAEIHHRSSQQPFYQESQSIAVLPITTYNDWWTSQISDKTRNMVRKAAKKGIQIKVVDFDDKLVAGIVALNNESPMRQGRPYWHYEKDFETVKNGHLSFLARSRFIGAFLDSQLIGYIKLVEGNGKANIMQILSMISHRDKAPNNALIAKAVEICAERKIPLLHYGSWSRRTLGDFKLSHGFQRFEIPRYYVPLNAIGSIILKVKLHRRFIEFLPESWIDRITSIREKWYSLRYRRVLRRRKH